MPTDGSPVVAGEKQLEVQLAWAEYKNGKWSAKKLASPFLSTLTHPEMELSDAQFKLFSFKTRIQKTTTRDEQLFIDCYGPVDLIKTVTITSTDAKAVKETALFSLGPGKTQIVSATVDGKAFQPSDVTRVEIRKKDSAGTVVQTIKLGDDGSVEIKNTSTTATFKYWLASADYQPGKPIFTGQRTECWFDDGTTSRNLVGSNGNGTSARATASTTSRRIDMVEW